MKPVIEMHIRSCIEASVLEMNGAHERANRLRANAILRLVSMSEDDLCELAYLLSDKYRTPKEALESLQKEICRYKDNTEEWLPWISTDIK